MTIEQAAMGYLQEVGVPTHFSGFRQLHTAICICYRDCDKLCMITKVLYPEIAKAHRLGDWRRVERNMRAAIRRSRYSHMTNSMFISNAVWDIMQYEQPPV